MEIVKKVERIVKENCIKDKSYQPPIIIEKKPYDFGNVKTISEDTNKPQNKNIDGYENSCDHTYANIQYSIWY